MRIGALVLLLGLAISVALTARAALPPPTRTIPTCAERIDVTKWPYVGNRRLPARIVLGVVAAPPALLSRASPTLSRQWPYFAKKGLVVRGNGASVTIVVPKGWRSRFGIAWGYGDRGGVLSSLRIAGCRSDPATGNAYSGGFYLRSRTACVPLVFRVGTRSATVRFGIGRRCR